MFEEMICDMLLIFTHLKYFLAINHQKVKYNFYFIMLGNLSRNLKVWKIPITVNVTLFIQHRLKNIVGLFNRFPNFSCDAVYGSSQEMITDCTVMAPMLDLAVKSTE